MPRTIVEPQRTVSVLAETEVLAAGGGVAGVAAAVAAARAGARTVLIERQGFPGGVAIAILSRPTLGSMLSVGCRKTGSAWGSVWRPAPAMGDSSSLRSQE